MKSQKNQKEIFRLSQFSSCFLPIHLLCCCLLSHTYINTYIYNLFFSSDFALDSLTLSYIYTCIPLLKAVYVWLCFWSKIFADWSSRWLEKWGLFFWCFDFFDRELFNFYLDKGLWFTLISMDFQSSFFEIHDYIYISVCNFLLVFESLHNTMTTQFFGFFTGLGCYTNESWSWFGVHSSCYLWFLEKRNFVKWISSFWCLFHFGG